MNKQLNQGADDQQKEIHTTHVQVVDIKIEAATAEAALKLIAEEFEKCHHLHQRCHLR